MPTTSARKPKPNEPTPLVMLDPTGLTADEKELLEHRLGQLEAMWQARPYLGAGEAQRVRQLVERVVRLNPDPVADVDVAAGALVDQFMGTIEAARASIAKAEAEKEAAENVQRT